MNESHGGIFGAISHAVDETMNDIFKEKKSNGDLNTAQQISQLYLTNRPCFWPHLRYDSEDGNDGRRDAPPLRCGRKYLIWMGCHKIWYGHSFSPEV